MAGSDWGYILLVVDSRVKERRGSSPRPFCGSAPAWLYFQRGRGWANIHHRLRRKHETGNKFLVVDGDPTNHTQSPSSEWGYPSAHGHNYYGIISPWLWMGLSALIAPPPPNPFPGIVFYDIGPANQIVVEAGYRCPVGNAFIGGVAGSQHILGTAFDFWSKNSKWGSAMKDSIEKNYEKPLLNAKHFIRYSGHIHLDWRIQ